VAPTSRFTVRTAPATPVPTVVRRATPAAEPAAAHRAVAATAAPRRDPTPWQPAVATIAGGADEVPALDLDAVTGEVLRRIERRAIAQRERLGWGTF
jgi:hypothetical protein